MLFQVKILKRSKVLTALLSNIYKYSERPSLLCQESERMLKMRSRKFFKISCKRDRARVGSDSSDEGGDIEWELRPGGMLVQKRGGRKGDGVINVRISTGSSWHNISIGATSTFGDLKVALSMATGLEQREQRLLFKGKEREDCDHLHMVGVGDGDKVLLLQDPAIKERKLLAMESFCSPTIVEL